MAALNPTEYAWIIPPTSQFLDVNGKPLVGGYCVIYIHGTTGTPYTTYQNWEGTENPIEIPIDILGHAPAIGSVNYSYDLYLYDSLNALVYSRLNLGAYGDEGTFSIHTDSTLHGNGSVSDPLGVEKSEVISGLVRGIVPESDNVHVRTYQYLEDGSIMVGLRVDKTEYTAGTGIKIEDDVISLEDLGEFEGSLMVAEGSATSGTNLNTGMSVLKQEGDSIFVQQNVLKLNKGIYHVDAFIKFGALSNASEYDLTFLGHNGAKLAYTFDNTYAHTEVINFSFDADIEDDGTPLTLTLDSNTAPSAYSMQLEAVHIMKVIMESGIGSVEYHAGAGIEIDPSTNTISTNFNTVQKKLTAGDNITIDQANGVISAADQVQSNWNETDPSEKSYIQNKPTDLVHDSNYVHTDNNFTNADKSKLDGIEAGAEVNVQADWNQSNSSADDYIKNKPGDATESSSGFMSAADKTKLDGIEAGAEANVQADWDQSNSSADDYIKNKPTNLVPVPTAQDTDKILTATGAGAYSWQNPPKGVTIVRKSDAASTAASQVAAAVADGKVVYCFVDIGTEDLFMPLCQVSEDGNQYRFFGVVEAKTLYEQTLTKTNNVWAWDAIAEKTIIDPVQSDWTEQDTSSLAYILHKPPTLPLVEGDDIEIDEYNGSLIISSTAVPTHTAADSTKILAVDSNGELHWVDPSGATQVQSNWNETDTSDPSYIQNKPDLSIYAQSANLATVATTGDYDDLLNKPTIPAAVIIGTIEL